MKNLWRKLLEWLWGRPSVAPPADNMPQYPASTPQTLWPAQQCPNWMIHTSDHKADDAIRAAAWEGAKAAGLDAIQFKLKHTDNEHLIIALFAWEHPKEYRFRLDNFTQRALDKGGVKRWVVELPTGISLEWVADVFRFYGPGGPFQAQFTGIPITAEVRKVLGCDGQGVKTAKPERRVRK
jgi:hypothetical protein